MSNYKLVYTRQAQKDAKKVSASGLKIKVQNLLNILEHNPFQDYPPFEKLQGDLAGAYSRRINIQHRLVYQVLNSRLFKRCLTLSVASLNTAKRDFKIQFTSFRDYKSRRADLS